MSAVLASPRGIAEVLGDIAPGARLYVPGGSGEPSGLIEALQSNKLLTAGSAITTTFLPGVNKIDLAALHETAVVSSLFMQSDYGAAQRDGRFRHMPLSYSAFQAWLEADATFDVSIVQVSAPDEQGRCSLGAAVEFTPAAIRRSKKVVGVVNRQAPFVPNAASIQLEAFYALVDVDAPLATYGSGATDAVSLDVARNVAPLIEDASVLQVGIGKTPGALLELLRDRRELALWSGMLSDGVIDLAAAGTLRGDRALTGCMALGTRRLYDWIAGNPDVHIAGCDVTHNPLNLFAIPRLVAVNAAIEVDLFGQCNLERLGGRAISGAGGAPDFSRAGRHAAQGKSIVALPSTGGGVSRIVPVLDGSAVTTIPRTDVDFIVTELGAADLRGKSVFERAEAIMAVAAPRFATELERAWREIRDGL